jgi:iron complex transport system permease protein
VRSARPLARPAAGIALALGFAALAAALGVFLGPAGLGFGETAAALLGASSASPGAVDIVWIDRVPRVALGLAVGAGLSVAGVLFQSLLRNPLADPYLVGVGPGALLGAALAGAAGLLGTSVLGFSAVGLASFAGAVGAAALVLFVAGGGGRAGVARLVLAGVAVGSFVTAVATWALYVETELWQNAVRWLLGSLAWADGSRIAVAAAATVGLALLALWRARDLDALSIGEDSARLGGVDVARSVLLLVGAACALTAACVAAAGLVGFVGLVVPHAARRLVGPLHRRAIPVAAGLGAGLLVLADAVARTVARVEVPVGVVTALLGAPAFALLVRRAGRAA